MENMDAETKEQERKVAISKLDGLSKEQMLTNALVSKWRDIFSLTKILISQVGKEKAKELLAKAKYDEGIELGKEFADRGYAMTMDGHDEAKAAYMKEKVKGAAWKSGYIDEECTEERRVRRATTCYLAKAILKVAEEDPETFEVAKYFEPSDEGWAHGFNPNMKFKRTKWLLDGDPYCEFIIE